MHKKKKYRKKQMTLKEAKATTRGKEAHKKAHVESKALEKVYTSRQAFTQQVASKIAGPLFEFDFGDREASEFECATDCHEQCQEVPCGVAGSREGVHARDRRPDERALHSEHQNCEYHDHELEEDRAPHDPAHEQPQQLQWAMRDSGVIRARERCM